MTPLPPPISIRSLHTAHHSFHKPKVITLPKLGRSIKKIIWGKKGNTFLEPACHRRAWRRRSIGCRGSASPRGRGDPNLHSTCRVGTKYYIILQKKKKTGGGLGISAVFPISLLIFVLSCMTKMPYFCICNHALAAFPAATEPPPHPAAS